MKKFNNVLFVGTGGGNDIFSTTLAMASLWQLGWRWNKSSIAGILSPFHKHTIIQTFIPGVFETTSESCRFLTRKDDPRQIGFVDARVSAMISQEKIFHAESVYGLSIKNGSHGLTSIFQKLHKNFDFIVLVDIGGDCFYNGDTNEHVLSPMFDAIAVRAFVDSKIPGILFEAGPGTDGELGPELLENILSKVRSYSLDSGIIDWWDIIYSKWIKDYRPGRTVSMTIEAFRSEKDILEVDYRARAHLGRKKYYKFFKQLISTNLCKRFYLVEPSSIQNPFAVSCANPKDWFIKTQIEQHRTNNEVNLEYLFFENKLCQFLTPSPLFAHEERMKIIEQGLNDFEGGRVCDGLWMLIEDWNNFPELKQKYQYKANEGLVEINR